MLQELWSRVAEKMQEHDYMTGVERTVARVRASGEIFTPTPLVIEMMQYLDLDIFAPGRTVLDPACGDGQFLVAAKWVKVYFFGLGEVEALQDLYGIDIMRDNVDVCRHRLGGGTIVMGDALKPTRVLEGQTSQERDLMVELFLEATTKTRKKTRVLKKASSRQVREVNESDAKHMLDVTTDQTVLSMDVRETVLF